MRLSVEAREKGKCIRVCHLFREALNADAMFRVRVPENYVNFDALKPVVARGVYTLGEVLNHAFRRRTEVLHG